MSMDRLSEMLELVEVQSAISGSSSVRGRWRTETDISDDLKFIAIVRGRAILRTNEVESPIVLEAGDVAVLNRRSWLQLDGGEGDTEPIMVNPPAAGHDIPDKDIADGDVDILIGGRVELNELGRELVLASLPPVIQVTSSSDVAMQARAHVQRLFSEMTEQRAGADFAIKQYAQLLVLDIIRGFVHGDQIPAGWLRILTDSQLRPAVDLMHEHPAKNWGLQELARASNMSRSAFAQRFREVAGTPPITYLINWRMLRAQKELATSDIRIAALARSLGYASESSFSSAFKRQVGSSPSAYRTSNR